MAEVGELPPPTRRCDWTNQLHCAGGKRAGVGMVVTGVWMVLVKVARLARLPLPRGSQRNYWLTQTWLSRMTHAGICYQLV
jgi:hypothetical protein